MDICLAEAAVLSDSRAVFWVPCTDILTYLLFTHDNGKIDIDSSYLPACVPSDKNPIFSTPGSILKCRSTLNGKGSTRPDSLTAALFKMHKPILLLHCLL